MMKFEKFFLIKTSSTDNSTSNINFHHVQNGRIIKNNFLSILQCCDIQVQTQFLSKTGIKIVQNTKGFENCKIGDTINVFYIPVVLDIETNEYKIHENFIEEELED